MNIKSEEKKFPFLLQSCRLWGQMDWWTMVVISNTVFSFIPNDPSPCHNTLWNWIMDVKLVKLKSVIYLMHWKYGNFFQVALTQQSKFWETDSLDDLWSLLMLQQQEHLSYCWENSFVLNGYHVTLSVKMNFIAFKLFKIYFTSNRVWLSPLSG